MSITTASVATWCIAAAAVTGVLLRPMKWPEAWWAASGALALVLLSLMPLASALAAVARGTDVYLFLAGMMILAELARTEGLFDWLATRAVHYAHGSGTRLFTLVYAVGILVTIFLSNDATAVVLTPAVYAAARQAKATPLPYLFICAFVANAASFVLPISNPANLVVFADRMPSLISWLAEFGPASACSIVLTFGLLLWTQRKLIPTVIVADAGMIPISAGGRIAAAAVAFTAIVLLAASSMGWQLGLPTFVAGVTAWLAISGLKRTSPWPILRQISWSVLVLVAGLFVLVQAVEDTGAFAPLVRQAAAAESQSPRMAALIGGSAVGIGANFINNLPMGLITASVVALAQLSAHLVGALLIGVDLGPNLSITGSLATILWLVAIRREGEDVGISKFLAVGAIVMLPTLLATLAIFNWL